MCCIGPYTAPPQPDVIEYSVDVDVRETNDEGLAICCLSADDVASFFFNLLDCNLHFASCLLADSV